MSDTKDEEKPVQLLKALVRNKRFMALATDVQPLATEHVLVERRLVGVRVAQQVLVVALGADVEAAGEERGRHADLRYEARRLAEQQRDDSEQHQLFADLLERGEHGLPLGLAQPLGEAREGALDEEAGSDHERGDGCHGPGGRLRQRPPLLRRHPAPLSSPPDHSAPATFSSSSDLP